MQFNKTRVHTWSQSLLQTSPNFCHHSTSSGISYTNLSVFRTHLGKALCTLVPYDLQEILWWAKLVEKLGIVFLLIYPGLELGCTLYWTYLLCVVTVNSNTTCLWGCYLIWGVEQMFLVHRTQPHLFSFNLKLLPLHSVLESPSPSFL